MMLQDISGRYSSGPAPVKRARPAERRKLHIIVLGGRDPNDLESWSGVPKHIVNGLRSQGHEVTTIGPLPSLETAWPRLKGLYYRLVRQDYVVIRDPAMVRARMLKANELLRMQPPADAVVVMHAADAAYLETEAPLILVHDATWQQLLDFYPRYRRDRLAPETIAGGREIDARALANCDGVIYSSSWPLRSVVADYGIDTGKIAVHPFGANIAHAPGKDELQRSIKDRGQGVCRLLLVGRDWVRKGGDSAVAVAQELHDRGLPVELQIVGCNPPDAVPDFVRRFGFLSKDNPAHAPQLRQLLLAADFFLLPTKADCTPIALNEAAAFGLPVATTAIAGIPDMVDESWGVALPPDAPAGDYAQWILSAYTDRSRYASMARAARERFDRLGNWDTFCRSLTGLIDELRSPDRVRRASGVKSNRASGAEFRERSSGDAIYES